MWPTTSVSVYPRDWSHTDRLGNHTEAYLEMQSADVLIAPGSTYDLGTSRPEGVSVDLTLHFKRGWSDIDALRGAKIVISGTGLWDGEYRVIGNPKPYVPSLVPHAFYLPVEVTRYDG